MAALSTVTPNTTAESKSSHDNTDIPKARTPSPFNQIDTLSQIGKYLSSKSLQSLSATNKIAAESLAQYKKSIKITTDNVDDIIKTIQLYHSPSSESPSIPSLLQQTGLSLTLEDLRSSDIKHLIQALTNHPTFARNIDAITCHDIYRLTDDKLSKILQTIPQIQSLAISNAYHVSKLPDTLTFPNLTNISLCKCNNLQATETLRVLQANTQIKHLTLNSVGIPTIPTGLTFPNLETLTIQSTGITQEDLERLLRSNLHIKQLILDEYHLKTLPHDLIFPNLSSLNININRDIPETEIISFFRSNIHIKILEIYGWTIKTFPSDLHFLYLDTFIFRGGINDLNFNNFLSANSHIRCLDLEGTRITTFPEKVSLPNLEEVNLGGSPLTNLGISNLLHNTPKLTKLNLNGARDISSFPDNLPMRPYLTELQVTQCQYLIGYELNRLLKVTPNIRILHRTALYIPTLPTQLNLVHMEELHMRGGSVSAEETMAFIETTPCMRLVDLVGNDISEDDKATLRAKGIIIIG